MVKFSDRMVPERVQVFWTALQRGAFITDATAEAGTYREKGPSMDGCGDNLLTDTSTWVPHQGGELQRLHPCDGLVSGVAISGVPASPSSELGGCWFTTWCGISGWRPAAAR